jgi:hypothetical protein
MAPFLQAQSPAREAVKPFDATNLRQPTDLAATWLVHAGDDPAYARSDFDDSQWLPFNSTKSLKDLFPHSHPEIVWCRLRVKVAPDQTGLALREWFVSSAFEIYTNGALLIQSGKVKPFVRYTSKRTCSGVSRKRKSPPAWLSSLSGFTFHPSSGLMIAPVFSPRI